MKHLRVKAAGLALALTFTLIANGCAYLHVQRPLSVDFNKTNVGAKEGRASSYSVLWLFAWGNSGLKAAATQGHLQTIESADTEMFAVLLGIYARMTTVVYGN